MSRHLVWMLLSLYAVSVNADWITIGSSPAQQLEHFIDKDSVKQSGPMAIFRQVQVLSHGSELKKISVQSVLGTYEYDCMNAMFRILQETGFSEQWGVGEKRSLTTTAGKGEWKVLPESPLGQMMFDFICPSGNDSQ